MSEIATKRPKLDQEETVESMLFELRATRPERMLKLARENFQKEV